MTNRRQFACHRVHAGTRLLVEHLIAGEILANREHCVPGPASLWADVHGRYPRRRSGFRINI